MVRVGRSFWEEMIPERKVGNRYRRQLVSHSCSQRFSPGTLISWTHLSCRSLPPAIPQDQELQLRAVMKRGIQVLQPKPAQTGEEGKLLNPQEPEPIHIDFVPLQTHIVSSTGDFYHRSYIPFRKCLLLIPFLVVAKMNVVCNFLTL